MGSSAEYLVGVDVGGTFTDILAYRHATGTLLAAKVPSFPGEQWRGVLDALSQLGILPTDVHSFVHGTTIATNALLEHKGAPTGLLTTKGFRDILEIGKGRRLVGGLFDTAWRRPPPIVPRDLRIELLERTSTDGRIESAVDAASVAAIAQHFKRRGIKAIAVVFLNSYLNNSNEKIAADMLRTLLPDACISQSAALAPERGEFERTSTCVLNAYLTPLMVEYLNSLVAALAERGVDAPISVMGSNGGAMTLDEARERVVGTFLSGPVGGVNGAIEIAKSANLSDVITFDMGGTSTDVALVKGLEPRMSYDNQIDAYPLQMPQLDIRTIGSGGGSIVWIDSDETLQVGPRSAGALPGPACYGRGGQLPTISDANLILGRLSAKRPLSGDLKLDLPSARTAFGPIARRLADDDVVAVARAAVRIAVAKMAAAVRAVSVHRGFDPGAFTLVGFGGAGPMHVFEVAEELEMPDVLIPRYPGHLCALGQMLADLRRDTVSVWGGRIADLSLDDLKRHLKRMQDTAENRFMSDDVERECQRHFFTFDMRYSGQSFTLPIAWHPEDENLMRVRGTFDSRHHDTFGYATPDKDVEIVSIRLTSVGVIDKPVIKFSRARAETLEIESRYVWFSEWTKCPVLDRNAMRPGYEFHGPAVVEEPGGTSVIPPGWAVLVHESGALQCKHPDNSRCVAGSTETSDYECEAPM